MHLNFRNNRTKVLTAAVTFHPWNSKQLLYKFYFSPVFPLMYSFFRPKILWENSINWIYTSRTMCEDGNPYSNHGDEAQVLRKRNRAEEIPLQDLNDILKDVSFSFPAFPQQVAVHSFFICKMLQINKKQAKININDKIQLINKNNPTKSKMIIFISPNQVALAVKKPPVNEGDIRDAGSILWLGRSPGGGHSNPPRFSCLENPMDRGAWRAIAPSVTVSDTTEVT